MRAEPEDHNDTAIAIAHDPRAVPTSQSLHRHGIAGLIVVGRAKNHPHAASCDFAK